MGPAHDGGIASDALEEIHGRSIPKRGFRHGLILSFQARRVNALGEIHEQWLYRFKPF
jgi:hypothetical protein